MWGVGRDDVERSGAHDSGIIADGKFHLALQDYSPLLVRMAMKRNHRVAIELQIREHQILPKRGADAKPREKFKRLDIRYLIERQFGFTPCDLGRIHSAQRKLNHPGARRGVVSATRSSLRQLQENRSIPRWVRDNDFALPVF